MLAHHIVRRLYTYSSSPVPLERNSEHSRRRQAWMPGLPLVCSLCVFRGLLMSEPDRLDSSFMSMYIFMSLLTCVNVRVRLQYLPVTVFYEQHGLTCTMPKHRSLADNGKRGSRRKEKGKSQVDCKEKLKLNCHRERSLHFIRVIHSVKFLSYSIPPYTQTFHLRTH